MDVTDIIYDVFVVGGGINGVGIANDAVGRGLSVVLCEMNDLASATSSASSKLIHGGLRYLEYYQFGLVRKALAEREVLLNNAPHIISPLMFCLPHQPHLRPAWLIRAGLFLYDNLSRENTLPRSQGIRFNADSPLKNDINKGFEYADAWVDDARLTVLNAIAASEHGASILTQTKLIAAQSSDNIWRLTLLDNVSGQTFEVKSKSLVNAAGPWIDNITEQIEQEYHQHIRLVKGSHIVVPRIYEGEQAYILQNTDQRIVFVLPFEQDYSLIGTTDIDYQGDPQQVAITPAEIDYLVNITNGYFKHQICRQSIVHTFSGVRPLLDEQVSDAKAVTRDYAITLTQKSELSQQEHAPLVTVYGGKITTYRLLAEAAVNKLSSIFPAMSAPWTKHTPLPGGDFSCREALLARLAKAFPWLPLAIRQRYVKSYGTRCLVILANCHALEDLGEHFGAGLYQKELCYLVQHEWAKHLDDVIWRRTKLGLRLNAKQKEKINHYMRTQCY